MRPKRGFYLLYGATALREYTEKEQWVGNIVLDQDGGVDYIDESGSLEALGCWDRDDKNHKAWLRSDEVITLPKGCHPWITEDIKTTYGEALINFILLWAPFRGKVPYVKKENDWLTPKDYLKAIESVPKADDPANPKPGEITPAEMWRCVEANGWLQGLNVLFTPAATEDTLTIPKEVQELTDKLMKEAFEKGLQNDAAHMAWVEEQVIAKDMEVMEGKPGAMFLKRSQKSFGVARKRMFSTFGTEASIEGGGKVETIRQPLSKGLDMDHLPEQANTMRNGIAGRGVGTALGGAEAKKDGRVTQGAKFAILDCNTKLYLDLYVNPRVADKLVGRILFGGSKPLTKEKAQGLIGKWIKLRSPVGCKAKVLFLNTYYIGV